MKREGEGSAVFGRAVKATNVIIRKSCIKEMIWRSAFLWQIWSTLAMNMSQSSIYTHVEAD
jgi:hypothetical protein